MAAGGRGAWEHQEGSLEQRASSVGALGSRNLRLVWEQRGGTLCIGRELGRDKAECCDGVWSCYKGKEVRVLV